MIGKIISHYKILEKLGEGGMGVVYKAQDTKLDRIVALKFLPKHLLCDAEAKTRFEHEAKAASALDHPNIATIYEIDEFEGECFISMAYVEGKSLKKLLEEKTFSVNEVVDIAIQICEGLEIAHEKGIIHRDIKSDNIMLSSRGQVRIMDFGLAKLKGAPGLTKTGSTHGTIAYMSPEQARGEEVDHRTDIWSLGVVLYEILSGQMPFKSEYEQAIIYSILNEEPMPINELTDNIPKNLDMIVKKAMEKDPTRRYQSADEIIADLKALKEDFALLKKPRIRRRKVTRKSLVILIPITVVFIVVLIILLRSHREGQTLRKIPMIVMFFENQTGEDKYQYLRKVLANLLITDLTESRYIQVMPYHRMLDILKSLGYRDVEVVDDSIGFQMCRLKGVPLMVLGSLTKSGDIFVLNAQLMDVDTRKQIAAYRVTGKGENSILEGLIDDLTDKIKKGMKISRRDIQREKRDIAELSTNSLEAYRYYFTGQDAAYKMRNREAIKDLETAVTLDSAFIEAYDALARQYYFVREITKALKVIEKVKPFTDKLAEGKLFEFLALEAYIRQDWDRAIYYNKRLIEIDPENISAHLDLGTLYYQKKMMYDQGISEFKRVLELDPQGITRNNSFTYNLLGWAYIRKGQNKKALEAFNEYVTLSPDQAYPLDVLAEINLRIGNYEQAIINLKQSLEIKPDYPVTSALLGDTYLAKGMYGQALYHYQNCLVLSRGEFEQSEAHCNLGNLYFLKEEYAQALEQCQKALELAPQMIKAHWIQGLTFVKKGMLSQADSAATIIKRLIEETKAEDLKPNYYHLLGELFLSKGLYPQALENLNLATSIWSLERTFYINAMGEAYLRIGELSKALEKFKEVLEINPNYAETHYQISLVYERNGKKERARDHLREFMEIWKDADVNLPWMVDAKRKLTGL